MVDATPAETMQRIAAAARSGRMDEASLMVTRARMTHGADPVLAALGGAIEFHRGQFDRAIPLLREAHARHPQDVTVRANLAEALYRSGQLGEARALCDEASAKADRSLRLARLGAFLAQEAEEHETAISLYRQIVAAVPDDWSSWNNLGNAYSAIGNFPAAVEALEQAVQLAPDSQPIKVNLGNILLEGGDPVTAEVVLREAAESDPADPTPLLSLFTLYRRSGREDDAAFEALAEAARRKPDDAKIQDDLAHEAARIVKYDDAVTIYRKAISLQPGMGTAYVGLASVFDRANLEDELEPLREQAVAEGLALEPLEFIDALRFKRAGKIEEAFAALERAGDVVSIGRRMHLRGTMLDRIGRHDEAFEAFVEMNRNRQEDLDNPLERAKSYREYVASARALTTQEWYAGWTPPIAADPARPSPVFLGSFPRSGTTLLDTMLMSDPRVVVLEEEPFIAELEGQAGGVEALAGLDADALDQARENYWRRVSDLAEIGPDTIVIDKQPLHTNKVQTIHRFFPDAKFVLALRHPCDVLLSCFLTNFRTNHAMSNFLDLDDAVTLYDLTFAHWENASKIFDMQVYPVIYERLVEDKARELRPLFHWLGLEWPGDEHDHREAARARGVVTTASYAQVTEPLYKRAAGRWHNYAKHLEPVLDRMRPWVERYGYSLEDGRFAPWPDEAIDAA